LIFIHSLAQDFGQPQAPVPPNQVQESHHWGWQLLGQGIIAYLKVTFET